MKDPLLHISPLASTPLDFLIGFVIALVSLAMIARYIPSIPEPNLRFNSPMGRLPFFDGVVIYGLVLILVGFILKFIEIFL